MKKKILIISAIAVLAVTISLIVIFLNSNNFEPQTPATTTPEVAHELPSKENEIIFKDYANKKISQNKENPTMPKKETYEKDGYVFMGWGDNFDKYIENEEKAENIEVHPGYVDISNSDNAFVLPAVYAKSGNIAISQLKLCGNVKLCAFDITVKFDPKKMSVDSIENLDRDIIANIKNDDGKVYMNFISKENIESEIDIGRFIFKQKTDKSEKIPVEIEITEISMFDDKGEIKEAKSKVVTSFVYFY